MNLINIFKSIGKGGLKVADIGAKVNLPIFTQIDAVADSIKGIKGKTVSDKDAITQVAVSLSELKTAVAAVPPPDKGFFESKKAISVIVGIAVTLAAPHLGLTPDQATQLIDAVTMMVVVLVGAQGIQDAVRNMK